MLCDGFTYFSQKVGVTATLPHSVPLFLPTTEAGSDEWYYRGNRLYHNQSYTEFPNIPSLNDLSIHQRMSVLKYQATANFTYSSMENIWTL